MQSIVRGPRSVECGKAALRSQGSRKHRAAYDLWNTSNCANAQGAELQKEPGGLTHPDLSQMADLPLAKTSFDAEASSAPKVMSRREAQASL